MYLSQKSTENQHKRNTGTLGGSAVGTAAIGWTARTGLVLGFRRSHDRQQNRGLSPWRVGSGGGRGVGRTGSAGKKVGHRRRHDPSVGSHLVTKRHGQRGGSGDFLFTAALDNTLGHKARPLGHHTETAGVPIGTRSGSGGELHTASGTFWKIVVDGVGETVVGGRFGNTGVGAPLVDGESGTKKGEDGEGVGELHCGMVIFGEGGGRGWRGAYLCSMGY